MGEPSPQIPQSTRAAEDRLDSWKEIAAYLNRDVTTVQRWEKREGMPVHRHLHDRLGSVYASRAELDAWAAGRRLKGALEPASVSVPGMAAVGAQTSAGQVFSRRMKIFGALGILLVAVAIAAVHWIRSKEVFWHSPIADARFEAVTDFDGVAEAASLSRDGQLVAFLSDRDGPMDVWLTQLGSGQFHNLTHGSVKELVNPSVRTLGFTPDHAFVTFWARTPNPTGAAEISIWAVPTLGGDAKRYMGGVAEYDWSRDGSHVAYHTPGPGDPMYTSEGGMHSGTQPIFTAAAGLHSHFPLWSPDGRSLYFVQGALPDKLDIWRIAPSGGKAERITAQNSQLSNPVFIDSHTLVYLASDPDDSGPWLYSMDVDHRIAHRLSSGLDRYTSLSASADGRRLVVTLATPRSTLWRLPIDGTAKAKPEPIVLDSKTASSPRIGPAAIFYVTRRGAGEGISKFEGGKSSELWRGEDAQIVGGPSLSRDGHHVAFTAKQHGRTVLYAMGSDGANARIVTDALVLKGAPAWAPDNSFILSAAEDHGVIHLFRIAVEGGAAKVFVQEYSVDPNWALDGSFVVYSGPDIGTTFRLKAVTAEGAPHPFPEVALTRGARHLTFLPGGHELVFLRGEIQHKTLWALDTTTGKERELSDVAPDFDIRDFDLSPDGREFVLERAQEHSNILLVERAQP
jgi:Tol biopolymer transport system component